MVEIIGGCRIWIGRFRVFWWRELEERGGLEGLGLAGGGYWNKKLDWGVWGFVGGGHWRKINVDLKI